MADAGDVRKLMGELHEKKILNMDTPMRALLEPEMLEKVTGGVRGGLDEVAASVFAWDNYGLVIKGSLPNLEEIRGLAENIRQLGQIRG